MGLSDQGGLIEPIAIPDTFAMGMEIEDLGNGMKRLVFYAPHPISGGPIERHVTNKVVVPTACIISMSQNLAPHAHEVIEQFVSLVPGCNHKTS